MILRPCSSSGPYIYLHVSQDCLASLSTLSDTHTSTPRPQPCPKPSQTMSVLPQGKLSGTPPLKTQEYYRVSLTIWKDQADRARTLLSPSPPKAYQSLASHCQSLTCCALGASLALDVPEELTEWRSSKVRGPLAWPHPSSPAYLLSAQPPVLHTVTKKVYGPRAS